MSKVKRGGLGKGVGALMGNNISPRQEKKIDITSEQEKKEIDVISEVDLVNEIKDKNYIKEYNTKITNRFNQSFEEVIKLYVNKRHLESLEKLKDFRLIKDKNYNLSDDWLEGFENNIRENAKNFLEIFKEKEL